MDSQVVFKSALIAVAIMLAYALPGFLFIKTKILNESHIPAFNKLLLYVTQPFLTLYPFRGSAYTGLVYEKRIALNMLYFFLIALALQLIVIGIGFVIYRKEYKIALYRISNIAMVFGNVGFFGIPLLESVMPGNPETLLYATMFLLSMNMLGWSLASTMITLDRKHINLKKMFLNPAVLPMVIALPMFLTNTSFPPALNNMVTVLAKMATPICMIILGMRLATIKFKNMFNSPIQYITIISKQILLPLFALGIVYAMPVDLIIKKSLFITCCCPVASIVLNFAELHGEGQESAANIMLLSTLLSIVTIPCMMLILPVVF